jgi:hypothetical protein
MSVLRTNVVLAVVLGWLAHPVASAQEETPAASGFSQEQLEQMVAPIALYADSLLAQVLMAATYPLEIVEADRWLQKQGGATGTALEEAMKSEDWDESVKSIVMVPDVLKRMSENLDWTRDLGDAFLAQKSELMDAVQRMRGKAKQAGHLESSTEQNVSVQPEEIIVIESTSPDVVYVPVYSTAVYGGSWAYPTPYYPYMYRPGWGLLSFGAGLAVGHALWGNCQWGWGHGDCNVDVNRYNNFGNVTNADFKKLDGARQNWNHDPKHRQGVDYKNASVAQKYGGSAGNRGASDRARGRTGAGAGAADRPAAGGGAQRPAAADKRPGADGGAQRPAPGGGGRAGASPSGGSAFQGASQPRTDRAASNRGSASRGGGSPRGGGGGGGRRGR